MVSVIQRTRKLKTLYAIRLGPGAAVLPREVTRIHMDFALKTNKGHWGAKSFWRNCLTRLKYHNPAIPMTVNRTNNTSGPALMTVHFTTPSSTTPPAINSTTQAQTSSAPVAASTPAPPTERTEVIDMKDHDESAILAQLVALTRARPVRPTADEAREMQELEEQRAKSEVDRARMQAVNDARKKEQAILIQARGELEASRET